MERPGYFATHSGNHARRPGGSSSRYAGGDGGSDDGRGIVTIRGGDADGVVGGIIYNRRENHEY
jgi:hypothetical protein